MYYGELYEPLPSAWSTLASAETEDEEQPSSVILKASWQVDQRKRIEADVFRKLDGAFGTPKYWYCVHPLDTRGGSNPISNIAFLPQREEIGSCFWGILSDKPPIAVEGRYLVLTLLATEGQQLTHVKTAEELVDCLIHSVLGMFSFKFPISLSPMTPHQDGGPFIKLASCTVMSALAIYSWLRSHLRARGGFPLTLKHSSGTQPLNLRRLHIS